MTRNACKRVCTSIYVAYESIIVESCFKNCTVVIFLNYNNNYIITTTITKQIMVIFETKNIMKNLKINV